MNPKITKSGTVTIQIIDGSPEIQADDFEFEGCVPGSEAAQELVLEFILQQANRVKLTNDVSNFLKTPAPL